jgi:hypothetical protein
LAAKVSFDPSVNVVDRSLGVRAGEAIADNPVASASYTRLQRQGTEVHFISDTSMPEMAVFDGNRNTVTMNLAKHSSPEDVASTLVHEATHQNRFFSGNQLGTQFEEYLSLRNEFLYGAGRRPSLSERQIIWQKTQELYPELPAGRTPLGGAQ